jgi:5'-nucleotidase
VLYSGTVSAALEGCILGYPSVAFSLTAYQDADFTYAGKAARIVAERVIANPLPSGTLLNVNIPNVPEEEIKGFSVTRLGFRKYAENYVERTDPRGRTYYWLAGEPINDDALNNTDIEAVKNKYVSITPLHYDLTSYDTIDVISGFFEPDPL